LYTHTLAWTPYLSLDAVAGAGGGHLTFQNGRSAATNELLTLWRAKIAGSHRVNRA